MRVENEINKFGFNAMALTSSVIENWKSRSWDAKAISSPSEVLCEIQLPYTSVLILMDIWSSDIQYSSEVEDTILPGQKIERLKMISGDKEILGVPNIANQEHAIIDDLQVSRYHKTSIKKIAMSLDEPECSCPEVTNKLLIQINIIPVFVQPFQTRIKCVSFRWQTCLTQDAQDGSPSLESLISSHLE
ncbi:predicted protein [Sclerotinia sclerotiorum 1980 UF-70]|uniref:Uncharacterized protein n=1 Tax=Sclerotinia sclerotiorum (strain ATCC 18683 / 1980 / Ss-1) TaxID=665079 RepID=A7EE86_SCLS1|nr:predicted protein [Sclerotinia sclerotiorum 1980 UF-70]EDO01152.1 predicted protein [Sclerotinia sclerotiorum 1980 UF-70]